MYEGGLDEHGEVLTFSRRVRYVPRSVGTLVVARAGFGRKPSTWCATVLLRVGNFLDNLINV